MKNNSKNENNLNKNFSTDDSENLCSLNVLEEICRIIEFIYKKAPEKQNEIFKKYDLVILKKIDFYEYLMNFIDYLEFTEEIFIISLIYLDLFLKKENKLYNKLNLIPLIIVSLKLAQKYYLDNQICTDDFNKVSGVKYKKFNKFENYLVNLIDWKLYIKNSEYYRYYNKLNKF